MKQRSHLYFFSQAMAILDIEHSIANNPVEAVEYYKNKPLMDTAASYEMDSATKLDKLSTKDMYARLRVMHKFGLSENKQFKKN